MKNVNGTLAVSEFCRVRRGIVALVASLVLSAPLASAQTGSATITVSPGTRVLQPTIQHHLRLGGAETPDAPVSALTHKPASLALAYAALDKNVVEWDDQHACATCHHTHSGIVANGIGGRKGAFDEEAIRRLAAHIEHNYTPSVYDYQRPGYTNAEAVWSSVSLGLWGKGNGDAAATKAAVSACKTALGRLPADNTNWPWLSFDMAPWEDESSPRSGVALLGVGVGLLDADLTGGAVAADKAKLKASLVAWMGQTNPLHLDLLLLWATGAWKDLAQSAPANFKAKVLKELAASQQADGGWSLVGIGSTNNVRCSASDGYSTGLAVLAMNVAGVSKADPTLMRGTSWIQNNQLADGMWATVSPTYNSPALGSREGDLTIMGSGFCAAALSETNRRAK